MPVVPHIQSGSKTTFLNKHNRHATVELQRPTSQDTVSHMLIITYFQPNHPSVNISVNIDGVNKGFLQAAYCPSTIGCRGIVLFGESDAEVFENPDIRSVKFSHLGVSEDEVWIDFFELAAPENVNEEQLRATVPVKLTADFITRCASNHFDIQHDRDG